MKKVIKLNEKELSDLICKIISEEKGQIKNRKKVIKENLTEVDFNYKDENKDEPSEEEIVKHLDMLYKHMDNLYSDAFDEINDIDENLASEMSIDYLEPSDLAAVLDDLSDNGPRHLSILAREILMLQEEIDEVEGLYHEVSVPPVHTKWINPDQ
jgi:hypothetical protein